MRWAAIAVVALVFGAACGSASGQSFGGSRRIAAINGSVAMAYPPGERGRLFVLTLGGVVHVVENEVVRPTPFLNVSAITGFGNGASGLVFDPGYAENGFFYIFHTTRGLPAGVPTGATIARYRVSESDPNVADPGSRTVILFVQPVGGQHTGGWIGFGRDGFLYSTGGDGNTSGMVQDRSTLVGKLLRLDVRADAFPEDDGRFYTIPAGNPLVGTAGRGEVWALGVRNSFRGSFDRETGDLWIGDVGGGQREEIDFQPAGSAGGENYGWPCREGFSPGQTGGLCANPQVFTPPVIDFTRAESGCIIGGYVYRGCANASMRGRYVCGNCQSQVVFSFDPASPRGTLVRHTGELGTLGSLIGFAEDAEGELYACTQTGVYKLLPREGTFTDCNANGRVDACEIADGSEVDADGDGIPDSCVRRCAADFDASGAVNVGDLFVYLDRYFAGAPAAEFDGAGGIAVGDLFAFLGVWFTGCP